ncbi:hypothetical protein [Aureispira anguillae]|uniref:DUF4348 domain-containing protein n=1 Tax=Aureispira anguillae TaxID=2864201 RepID=A0A915YIN0_9BACT|nr:hypothetical protein [Aureispira anguillae]BDS13702.1 hypothetical protein AsAng_0044430 [Aureispira anguillae]
MKIQAIAFFITCLFFYACTNNPSIPLDEAGREDFQVFRARFYEDSLFQIQRIEFPLLGKNPDGSKEPFYWEVENWRFKKAVNLESEEITMVPLFDMGDVMRERIIVQNRFMIENLFSLINNKWYLTQYSGIKDIGSFSAKKEAQTENATEPTIDSIQ